MDADNRVTGIEAIKDTILAWRLHNGVSETDVRKEISPELLPTIISLPEPALLQPPPKAPTNSRRRIHDISSDDEVSHHSSSKEADDSVANLSKTSLTKMIADITGSLLNQHQASLLNTAVASTSAPKTKSPSVIEEMTSFSKSKGVKRRRHVSPPSDSERSFSENSSSEDDDEGDLPSASVPARDKKFVFSQHWLKALGAIKACNDTVDSEPPSDVRVNSKSYPFQLSSDTINFLQKLLTTIQPSNIQSGYSVPLTKLSSTFDQSRVVLHSESIPEVSSFLSSSKLNLDLNKNVKNVVGLDNLRLTSEEVTKDSCDRQLAASALLLMDVNLSMIQYLKFLSDKISPEDSEKLACLSKLSEALVERLVVCSVAQSAETRLRLRRKLIPTSADYVGTLLDSSFISKTLCTELSQSTSKTERQGKMLVLKTAQLRSKAYKDTHKKPTTNNSHGNFPSSKWQDLKRSSGNSSPRQFFRDTSSFHRHSGNRSQPSSKPRYRGSSNYRSSYNKSSKTEPKQPQQQQ